MRLERVGGLCISGKDKKKRVKCRNTSYIHFVFSKFHLKFLLINIFIDLNILNRS